MGILSKPVGPYKNAKADSHTRLPWILAVPFFVLVGLAGFAAIFAVANRYGGGVATAGVLIGPPALLVLVLAFRRGLTRLKQLSAHLRWWHGLWLLLFASALVFRVRGVGDIRQDPLDAWAIYRVALELIVASVLTVRLALRRTPWFGSMFRGFVGVIAAFGLVELASAVWSVYPSWTLYKSCEYLLDVALLAAILATIESVEDYRHFFNWTWALYGFLLLSVWFGVVVWPQKALYPLGFKVGTLGVWLSGVVPNLSANNVATFAALLGLVALSRLLPMNGRRADRLWYGFLLLASMVTMILGQTRTAMAGFVFGVFLILLFSRRVGLSALLTFAVIPMVLLTSLGGLIWSFMERGETSQQLTTLSNRTVWWSHAWHTFLDRPLIGFGAYAAGRFSVLANLGNSMTSTLHSDYLEVIVGTGIWGLIPFLAVLLGTWWFLTHYLRHSRVLGPEQQLAFEAIAVLGLLSFRSIFMTMLTWHPPLHFLAIIGYAEFLRRRELREVSARQRVPEAIRPSPAAPAMGQA